MQLITRHLPPNHKRYFVSDLHVGSAMCHREGLKRLVAKIKREPSSYVDLGGDLIEAITVDDKRFQANATDYRSDPVTQCRDVAEILYPIKDRILYIMQGNHEAKLSRFGDLTKEIVCEELGAPYGTYTAKFSCTDKKGVTQYKTFYTHGAKSLSSNAKDPIQRIANMKATLKNRLAPLAGDCVVMCQGHTHQNFTVSPEHSLYLVDDGDTIKQHYLSDVGHAQYIHPDHRWYGSTGSWLRTYGEMGVSGYAERAGYAPVELGYNLLHVKDYTVDNLEKVVV